MTTMTTTQAVARTGTGLGITSFLLAGLALIIAFVASTLLGVILAVPALLIGILTIKKGSVKALPLTGIALSLITILGAAALMGKF